jgi:signal transduction histidine kinase/DNA-binding response OmpR family regulator
MKWRKSLLVSIIVLLIVTALTPLLIGYWISLANLRSSLEAREEDKASAIHSIVKSIIDMEIGKLKAISSLIRNDHVLAQALVAYTGSKETALLMRPLDEIYKDLHIDLLTVTDARGINLYSSKDGEKRRDLSGVWGMDEALEGIQMVSTDTGPQGFVISVITPLYAGDRLVGTIIAGIRIGDELARRIASETGSQIFFGTSGGVLASSLPLGKTGRIDPELVKHTLLDKKTNTVFDHEGQRVRLYAPVAVVDTHFCLVVESDASKMYLLLAQSRSRLAWASAAVLLLAVVLGSWMAVWITRPLRSLRQKAEGMIRAYSAGEVLAVGQGNEVQTLVRAFDNMVDVIRDHVDARVKANEELETRVRERTADLRTAKEAAESANRAKSQFLANMSHEIRTPMTGVLGFLDLLRGERLTERQREYTDRALTSGATLLQLINDILDFSKIEAGKLEVAATGLDLHLLVENVVDFFGEQAHHKGIELACQIDAGVPSALRGDPMRLRQILSNLLGNAIKFTEHGEVTVRVVLAEESERSVLLRFEIRDTGVGISPEALPMIFHAFTQADGSTTRKYGGTGLGLTIARQLVQMMDGRIDVRSVPGEGSTFWFTARLDRQDFTVARVDLSGLPFQGLRALVAAGKVTNRTILCRQLEGWGIRYGSAESGAQASEMLVDAAVGGDAYSAVIIDMAMPGWDDIGLARSIRADERIAGVRLIVLNAEGGPTKTDEDLGIQAYLKKPVKQSKLYNVLLSLGNRPVSVISEKAQAKAKQLTLGGYSSYRILLVEDSLVNQAVGMAMLESFGCRMDVAGNGREALEAIASTHYDLILMDCQMPLMDGYEATRAIREREASGDHRIPIIALTAHAMKGDQEICLEAGMDGYLSKPYKAEELHTILTRWLDPASDRGEEAEKGVETTLTPSRHSGGREKREQTGGTDR